MTPVPMAQTGSYATTTGPCGPRAAATRPPEVAGHHLLLSSLALLQRFLPAEDSRQTSFEKGIHLGRHSCIGVPKSRSALAVPHKRHHPAGLQHVCCVFTRVGSKPSALTFAQDVQALGSFVAQTAKKGAGTAAMTSTPWFFRATRPFRLSIPGRRPSIYCSSSFLLRRSASLLFFRFEGPKFGKPFVFPHGNARIFTAFLRRSNHSSKRTGVSPPSGLINGARVGPAPRPSRAG